VSSSSAPTLLSDPKQGCRKRLCAGIHRATHAPTPRGTVNASSLLAKAFFPNHLEKIEFTLDLFLLSDTLFSGRWGGYFSAQFMTMNGRRNVLHHPQRGPWLSNLFSFIHLCTLCPQRTASNALDFNHFRTLSHSTAGRVSVSASRSHPQVTSYALRLSSTTYELPNLQALCFHNDATVGGVPVRSKMPKWEGGENHIV